MHKDFTIDMHISPTPE